MIWLLKNNILQLKTIQEYDFTILPALSLEVVVEGCHKSSRSLAEVGRHEN